jgi:hypothetical protein
VFTLLGEKSPEVQEVPAEVTWISTNSALAHMEASLRGDRSAEQLTWWRSTESESKLGDTQAPYQ